MKPIVKMVAVEKVGNKEICKCVSVQPPDDFYKPGQFWYDWAGPFKTLKEAKAHAKERTSIT